ncbi:uncharacterized protein V6R79_013928 [Siganus canaliculatus]
MQQDSMHVANSGHITYNDSVTQEPSKKYIQCSQCALTFKTKVFLFEHLNQVHCYDVDTALKNAGLKATGTNKASAEEKSSNSGKNCKCTCCDFETHSWEDLHKHEKECPKKYEKQDVIKNVIISENPKTEFHLTSQEAAEAEEIILIIPTSDTTKELKTYKRPLQAQTITKFLVRSSESTEKLTGKLADGPEPVHDTPGTLLLQKSPSESSPNSSGVLKVTAKPTIDVVGVQDRFLLNDSQLSTDLQSSNSKERTIFPFPKNIKKTSDKSLKSPPNKKAQFDKEETKPQKNAITSEQQSSDKNLLLEFSEDEEEKLLTRNEKTRSPKRLQIRHDNARTPSMDLKNERSPQRPTSHGAEGALYHCDSCKFSHKSAVVMHVHYQKSHSEKTVTLDKIKQSGNVASPKTSKMTTDKSSNFVPTAEKATPKKNTSDTFELSANKCEPSQQIENPLSTPENTSETSNYLKSTKSKKVEFAEDTCDKKTLPVKRKRSSGVYNLSGTLLHCKYCSYSSTNLRSVVGHHNAKHYAFAVVDAVDILAYNAEMKQKGTEKETEPTPVTASSTSSASPTRKKAKLHANEKRSHEEEHKAESNPYAQAEKLYYCQKCNYGNITANGVLNHQARLHRDLKSNLSCVIKHTHMIRDRIKASKSPTKEFSFCTNIPLPFISGGDEDLYFCHFCNYRHPAMQVVVRHYSQSHHGFELRSEEICQYSSMLLERIKKSQTNTTASQAVSQTSLETTGKPNKKAETLSRGSASRRPFNTHRTLQCPECTYNTRYVYILKKHLKKIHRSNHSVKSILKICLDQGNLQPGYHCELCVFSHERALGLYEHYRDGHPGCKQSLAYVIKKLHVGPETHSPEEEKSIVIPSESSDDGDDEGGSAVSQRSRQHDSTIYSCRACLFKCGSLPTLMDHYRAVHPWTVKEDGSVLDVIDSSEPSNSTDIYQQTLEFDEDPHDLSDREFRCPLCSSLFPTLRGLKTHCGIKHPETNVENVVVQQVQAQPNPAGAHVFKCHYCTYVNTKHLGVIVHCQMKHPKSAATARSHYIDYSHMRNWRECLKKVRRGFRLSGFMCKLCPQIYVSLKKLNEHCKKFHSDADGRPKAPTTLPKSTTTSKRILKTKLKLNSQASVSKASFLSRNSMKCQHCSFACTTKLALNRHLRICHMDVSVSVPPDHIYQCALCSNLYFNKKNLGKHYHKRHGKEAYSKYFVKLQESEEASKTDEMQTDKKKIVFRCPRCCYVNASYYGTLTHCQMMHPDLTARADHLQTMVVNTSDMVGCTLGKGFNVRGFMCRKCPQIHKSIMQLKMHCRQDHKQATSESPEQMVTEKQTQPEVPKKNTQKTSTKESVSEQLRNLPQSAGSPDTRQPNNASEHNKKPVYKCHICTYMGSCRKYLHCHYRKTHRLDAFTTYKLLAKYNQRKRFQDLFEAESEKDAPVDCKKCPDLKFETSQMLIDHYRTAHSVGSIVDFIVICQPSKRTTGLYRCAHCLKQMNGIRKLCAHLDRHREREMASVAEKKSSTATEPAWPVLPTLETVEDLAQWSVAPSDTFTLPQTLLSSPSKPAEPEQPESPSKEGNFSCKHCRRTFNSMKGLRLHERSHAALAALTLKHVSAAKHGTDKYLLFKQGTLRPFLCSICSFRTTSMSLWKCHFLKRHQDVIMDPSENNDQVEESAEMADVELPHSLDDSKSLPEVVKEPAIPKKSLYSEPRDVQRQLSHYSLMAQAGAPSEGNSQEPKLLENSQLFCDICDFSTEHQSSIRRHYLNRHGKKLLKCKDCSFFTGSKKTLEKHIKTGHTTYQSEPTHQRDIRCPFCLYQTKNKNNMIDHIVLHREERVMPIEVRRPKLSRYLQGVVFRCHRCTFTSGSADTLRSHMMRHDDIKPYKCRLCYFDCSQLSDLEAHLSDKHQVLRNHELVGQVNLDQLEASGSRTPEEGEETSSTVEYQEYHVDDLVAVKLEEPHEEQDVGNDFMVGANIGEENSAKSSVLFENQDDNVAVKCEDSQEEVFTLSDSARAQGMGITVEQEHDEESKADIQFEDFDCPATERQMDDHQAECMLADIVAPQQKIETEEPDEVPMRVQTHGPHTDSPKLKILDTAAKVDDVVQDVSIRETHTKADHDRAVKTRQISESEAEDALLNDIFQLDGENRVPSSQGALSISVVTNHIQAVGIRTQQQFMVERHLLPLGPSCRQPKMSHQEASLTSCSDKQVPTRKNSEESNDSYGEMPVLENEYLKGKMYPLESCEDEDESDDLEQEQGKEDEKIAEADEEEPRTLSEEQDAEQMENPHMPKGALELTYHATTKDELFTCEFCGRKFMSSYELERHITRHGM